MGGYAGIPVLFEYTDGTGKRRTGWALDFIIEAWRAAGSPPINSPGRLKWEQQEAWDKFQNGTGSPADNPNSNARLVHVRGLGLDIATNVARHAAMLRAGFYRPYSYEPWHYELVGINPYNYPLIINLPTGNNVATVDNITSEALIQILTAGINKQIDGKTVTVAQALRAIYYYGDKIVAAVEENSGSGPSAEAVADALIAKGIGKEIAAELVAELSGK